MDELLAFRVKISAAGHDSYEGRSGVHDDLVFAASVACWFREWWNRYYEIDHAQHERYAALQPNG